MFLSNLVNSILSLVMPKKSGISCYAPAGSDKYNYLKHIAMRNKRLISEPDTELKLDGIDNTEQRRALSELKSARTLISKALMRINAKSNIMGKAGYDLTKLIDELSLKINRK